MTAFRTLWAAFFTAAFAWGQQAGIPVRGEGVPPEVESIYEKGLEFLAKGQSADGCWVGDGQGDEPGVVGLCTIAFLAHGEDPNSGRYAKIIRKGVDYILSRQSQGNGYIGNSMYNHGFATLALAEAYGVVDNPKIAPALRKAVDLILAAQTRNRSGAWRYTPESPEADTTVTGCCLVALFAARNAGLTVPDEALKKGLAYLAKCRASNGSVGYTSSFGGRSTLTAISALCFALAKEKDTRENKASVNFLRKNLEQRGDSYPFYHEYYMAQALFHNDEATWREWNARTARLFSAIQGRDGGFAGGQGTTFSTAAALLALALNYRYLPIYEK